MILLLSRLLYFLTSFPPMILSSNLPQLPSPTDITLDFVITTNYHASIISDSHMHISNHNLLSFQLIPTSTSTIASILSSWGPKCLYPTIFSQSLTIKSSFPSLSHLNTSSLISISVCVCVYLYAILSRVVSHNQHNQDSELCHHHKAL